MPTPPDGPAFDSFILCATPRTGSTLMCDLLTATRVAGAPDSFFMRDPGPVWTAEWGLPARGAIGDAGYAGAFGAEYRPATAAFDWMRRFRAEGRKGPVASI